HGCTLFPYTTLFRSRVQNPGEERDRRIERREAHGGEREGERDDQTDADGDRGELEMLADAEADLAGMVRDPVPADERFVGGHVRSEEHTSELQSLAY